MANGQSGFNPFPGSAFRRSRPERVRRFQEILLSAGVIATVRKTRGDDIDAACGQLAGQVRDKSRRTIALAKPPLASGIVEATA